MHSSRFLYAFLKRLIDVTFSLVCICIFAIPVFLIALVHKVMYGRGFFVQKRVGKDGKEFSMFKLSSMYPSVNSYEPSPLDQEDMRVTCLGKYLRSFGIDEIPQFVNVLMGDMSLVGPRPEMPFIVDTYGEKDRQRLSVLPGITGWWQIKGKRPLRDHHEYDFWYIQHRSIWLDLYILMITPYTLCKGR